MDDPLKRKRRLNTPLLTVQHDMFELGKLRIQLADALAPPIRTEADIRDDERERLAKLALSDASDLCKDRYLQDDRAKALRYLAEWLRSQTQVEE